MWLFAGLSAFFIGISKGGLKGMGPIVVLCMAYAFGAKASTGILVPLLLVGDSIALVTYRKFISKKHIIQFTPWVILGILIGVYIGKDLPEIWFKKGLAVLILSSLLILWYWDFYLKKNVKNSPSLTGITGLGAGIFTMLGNLAGAFSNIYFLMTGLDKKHIIGTSTLIFFLINAFKIPFHIFSWHTITWETLRIDVILIPVLALGFLCGYVLVKRISETGYRKFLYAATILGALFLSIQ